MKYIYIYITVVYCKCDLGTSDMDLLLLKMTVNQWRNKDSASYNSIIFKQTHPHTRMHAHKVCHCTLLLTLESPSSLMAPQNDKRAVYEITTVESK